MFSRDKRYGLIQVNYDKGNIKSFKDIFNYVPKSVIARDLGTRVRRFNKMIDKMENVTLKELSMIATFCEIDEAIMFHLAEKEYFLSKTKFENINPSISN